MLKDFSLLKSDALYNWYGERISREENILRLRIGDCVRVSVKRNPHKMRKGKYKNLHIDQRDMYFEITKIDRYKPNRLQNTLWIVGWCVWLFSIYAIHN